MTLINFPNQKHGAVTRGAGTGIHLSDRASDTGDRAVCVVLAVAVAVAIVFAAAWVWTMPAIR